MKELESIYDTLYHEDLQRQIAEVWFKEQKLSGDQIVKFLEISKHLYDKIDLLDITTVVQAVNAAYLSQRSDGIDAEAAAKKIFTFDLDSEGEEKELHKVDTYVNISGNAGDMT